MFLKCSGVCKKFGMDFALKNLDLSVQKGEIRAILGGNGSGKSTLAKLLGGALSLTSGSIELEQQGYHPISPIDAKKRGVIFTSQELSVFDNISIQENIEISSLPLKQKMFVDRGQMSDQATDLIKKYEMEFLLPKQVSELSANELYLVEFLKAIIQNPKLLIIDEITSALYRQDVEKVKAIIKELQQKGCTILFISHRMHEIMSICDSVTVLRNGESAGTYQINEVSEQQLLSLMSGRKISQDSACDLSGQLEDVRQAKTVLKIQDMQIQGFNTKIDLDVHAGEIICVAGLQGHGQSDLVRQLFGLGRPVDITISEKKYHIASALDAIHRGVAFISGNREREGTFQERSISDNLTPIFNLVMKKGKMDENSILDEYNVKYSNKRNLITSLSGGNQQKVVVARWTSIHPLVLLADDPTKGIDIQARADVHKIIVNLAKEGSAVIMVSSDDEELVALAHRNIFSKIIVMYEGEIVKALTGEEMTPENITAYSMHLSGGQNNEK